jgi:hypothetical protein
MRIINRINYNIEILLIHYFIKFECFRNQISNIVLILQQNYFKKINHFINIINLR